VVAIGAAVSRQAAAVHAGRRPAMLAYALPSVAVSVAMAAVTAILPTLYGKYGGVSLAALGALFAFMRIFDAVTDPLIGYWSDQTRTRHGARKPWVIAGALLTTVAGFFLFQIPSDGGIVYFGAWSAMFYLGFTMYQIPHMAWGSELTTDYRQRASLFALRGIAESIGGLVLPVLPLVLFYTQVLPDTEFTPDLFRYVGWAILLALPVTVAITAKWAPIGDVSQIKRTPLRTLWPAVRRNKPLLRFLAAFLVAGAGSGIYAALLFPYYDSYLKIGDKVPYLILVAMAAQLASQPFWAWACKKLGKHRCWGWGWIANSLSSVPMMLVAPGPDAFLWSAVLMGTYAFTNGVSSVAPFALLADVVDYEILKRGVDRAGNYYAFLLFLGKATAAVGGGVFALLGVVFGYQIAEGAVNSELANFGMVASFALLPCLFQIAAVPLIWNFPIDERRHDIIRRRIEEREARQARAAVIAA
jgi:glycoside/pentoside/hexuronide:cation symporter, GPH family